MTNKRSIAKLTPKDTLAFLPAVKRKRERLWEIENKTTSFSIPPRLLERARRLQRDLNLIAEKEFARVDEISRVLAQHGIACYKRGEVLVETRPIAAARKLTIMCEEVEEGWPVELPDVAAPKAEKNLRLKSSISYRWRDDTFKRIAEIAGKHGTHIAETAILMMETGVKKYLSGKMKLKKVQPVVENNISGWNEA